MSEAFSDKLAFVLKVLSMSRARLAADLGIDKSVVGRWVSGAVKPSPDNLSRLSALMAQKVAGFTALDWDRDLESLAALFGVGPEALPAAREAGLRGGLPMPLLAEIVATTAMRGAAYEGFFRSTRPYAAHPGHFVHDHCLVRKDENGLLRLTMSTGGVLVEGWVLLLRSQLFIIGAELTSGALVFAILHGVNSIEAEIVDGLTLSATLDVGSTPTASPIVLQRIGALSGDSVADEARLVDLAAGDPTEQTGSVPQALRDHLVSDRGGLAEMAIGDDGLLRMPLSRSMSRGFLPH
jgi:hypothetical protein